MKRLIHFALVAVMLCSCSIKEDRSLCPEFYSGNDKGFSPVMPQTVWSDTDFVSVNSRTGYFVWFGHTIEFYEDGAVRFVYWQGEVELGSYYGTYWLEGATIKMALNVPDPNTFLGEETITGNAVYKEYGDFKVKFDEDGNKTLDGYFWHVNKEGRGVTPNVPIGETLYEGNWAHLLYDIMHVND